MILADIDYQEQYSPSKWSTRMSADEIVPAHVEQVSFQPESLLGGKISFFEILFWS